jgi:ubiquinone/menaquinone biosynthesis C-methylase UbiE
VNENHKVCGSDEWRAHIRDEVLPWALAEQDLGDDVLEVGPGYGATTDVLCERAEHLTAVEIDPELVGLLRERFAHSLGVEIVEGDATELEFPDGRFSGAASFTMLHHVPTAELQDRLFAEVSRVLRPEGVFAVGDSLATPEREAGHIGDTYNPVDPTTVVPRLRNAGFARAEVRIGDYGWASIAVKTQGGESD